MLKKITIKQFHILFLLFIISSCSKNTFEENSSKSAITKRVNSFLNDWHLAASEANFENYFTKMDSMSVFIGTDASENWSKKQFENFSKPYFDKGKAWDFKTLERNIYINNSGEYVWFDELLDTWMGICRGSGVIEFNENNISIKHYVLSLTIPNDEIDGVIKIKKQRDSILLNELRAGL